LHPIQIDDIPSEIRNLTGQIKAILFPRQGYTSDVGIVECEQGLFVLKRTHGQRFCSWLRQEVHVLNSLAYTNLPIPRVHLYLEQETRNQCWAVMDYLEGEPLRQVLFREQNPDKRHEIIFNFGRILSEIHAVQCPSEIRGEVPWLDNMLRQAKFNLDNYRVDGNEELLNRLMTHKPNPIAQTLIHGDFTIDNVLVHDGRITGVIDWSGGAFGDPRYDLSLAIRPKPNAFQNRCDIDSFFAGYGKRPITDQDFAYFVGLYEFF
jgi:aminoglycoside phosphotransferase (APT) family kinase protein